MRRIDNNLVEVKKNLEFMEDMYDKVFRKVNRLLVDDEQAKNLIPDSWGSPFAILPYLGQGPFSCMFGDLEFVSKDIGSIIVR